MHVRAAAQLTPVAATEVIDDAIVANIQTLGYDDVSEVMAALRSPEYAVFFQLATGRRRHTPLARLSTDETRAGAPERGGGGWWRVRRTVDPPLKSCFTACL